MSGYWLGVLTIPLGVALAYLVVLALAGIRWAAGKAFGVLLRRYPPIRDGEDMGLDFPVRSATGFGHRSTFAAMALSNPRMVLFEPIDGLGIFIMAGRPKTHTKQTRRAKQAIERAYDDLLKADDQ
ncbi:hypothetical protein BLJ79_04190 [Arthrobacter sp. UCD-GKA]|uniref:hypothetical protein n=1 Tax=Arthrobacter sp. UCD-GKA TaxID=1913576 RepID=UPI0008DE0565|nr:hypothetical protein [Arthrobacter sp. UCD-GKA]OIH86001.1 hypothetical protein BLJ79_04190 [Arthrobacter sp. UCD-GKA]